VITPFVKSTVTVPLKASVAVLEVSDILREFKLSQAETGVNDTPSTVICRNLYGVKTSPESV
jgi:hypothetical protein